VQEHNRRLKEAGLQIVVIEDANHPAYPGRRVIATRRIPAHTVVGEYTGEILTAAQKHARYPEGCNEEKEGGYVFDNGKGLYIDAFDPRLNNVTRYVNGACTSYPANTTATPEGGKVHILTHARAIEKGEELWLNYGPAYTFAARAQAAATTTVEVTETWGEEEERLERVREEKEEKEKERRREDRKAREREGGNTGATSQTQPSPTPTPSATQPVTPKSRDRGNSGKGGRGTGRGKGKGTGRGKGKGRGKGRQTEEETKTAIEAQTEAEVGAEAGTRTEEEEGPQPIPAMQHPTTPIAPQPFRAPLTFQEALSNPDGVEEGVQTTGLSAAKLEEGFISDSRLRGVVIGYSGLEYKGTQYILVRTPADTVFWVAHTPQFPGHFRMLNTVSFTPTGESTRLKRWPDAFQVGEDPAEIMHSTNLAPFIPGIVVSFDGKSGEVKLTPGDFNRWKDQPEKLRRRFFMNRLTRDSVTPMVGSQVLVATQTATFGRRRAPTQRWMEICAIHENTALRMRSFTMSTTPSFYATLGSDLEANLEIGGTAALTPVPGFHAIDELKLEGIREVGGGRDLIRDILERVEAQYTAELHQLTGEERSDPKNMTVRGEKVFRMARTREDHRLRILINPHMFKHINIDKWVMLADRFMQRHDGSLVASIHILMIMDDRSTGKNWTNINSFLPIMKTDLRHLHSYTFAQQEVQLGRWAPHEWVATRSDCRYKAATLDFRTEVGPRWPEMVTLEPSTNERPEEETDTVAESGFNDATALLSSTPTRFAKDKSNLARWRPSQLITARAPRRMGPGLFTGRVLEHGSVKARDETAETLRAPGVVKGQKEGSISSLLLRQFMCMPADIFFLLHGLALYSPTLLLGKSIDFNHIYEALGADTYIQPIGDSDREFRICNPFLTVAEVKLRLGRMNAECKAAHFPPPFVALIPGDGSKPSWLTSRAEQLAQPVPEQQSPRARGKIYLSLTGSMDMEVITRALASISILAGNHPKWVEAEGYRRSLIEAVVDEPSRYTGACNTTDEGVAMCVVDLAEEDLGPEEGIEVFASLIPHDAQNERPPPTAYTASARQIASLKAARKRNEKRREQAEAEEPSCSPPRTPPRRVPKSPPRRRSRGSPPASPAGEYGSKSILSRSRSQGSRASSAPELTSSGEDSGASSSASSPSNQDWQRPKKKVRKAWREKGLDGGRGRRDSKSRSPSIHVSQGRFGALQVGGSLYDDDVSDGGVQEQQDKEAAGQEARPATTDTVDLTGDGDEQKQGAAQPNPANGQEAKHDGDTADDPMGESTDPDGRARKRKPVQEAGHSPASTASNPPHTPDDVLSQAEEEEDDDAALEEDAEEVRRKELADERRLERQERRSAKDSTPTAPAATTAGFLTPNPSKHPTTPDASASRKAKKAKKSKEKPKAKPPSGQNSIAKIFNKVSDMAKTLSPSKIRPGRGKKQGAPGRSRSPTAAARSRSRSPRRGGAGSSHSQSQPSRSGGSRK
jgi:hypothetical protein